ncbi:MAG: long-chain-fatty-acid--CoA ligase [Chromatiales bacterium]|jgi:long-chain acyl-CoA synthetase|nr:long-chain-fatty-acid--CoA ligase [Chromatiales bacterium]MDH4013262.1 long-chain-fatty-acid--CoA ligase [Chromatiales bacterium]
MEKIWLKNYPAGVPEEADLDEWPSLKHVFDEACKKYRDLPAFTNMGKTITYSELDQQSRYFGAFLQNNAGLEKGDRVALMMPNLLQYPVALFGVLRTGMVAVNVNPLYTPRELQHQLSDSGAKAIVILENFASTLEKVIDKTDVKTVIVTGIGDMLGFPKRSIVNFAIRHVKRMVPDWNVPHAIPFLRALNDGKWQTLEDVEVGQEDLAFLQYTGGTTGVSKGAMLSHRNMTANLAQMKAWLGQLDLQEPGTVITALPLYHIFALTVNLLSFLIRGGQNVLITNPRDFPAFVAEMKKYPFTFITGVNTLYNALLNTPGFSDIDFGPLKGSFAGGMAAQEAVAKQWKEVTGNVLTQGYGLTETSPVATSCLLGSGEYDGSIGVPMPSTDLVIRDDEGNDLPVGEIGEICIKGPQVMEGYWNRPEETAKVITEDGWLRTGDMGRMNENGLTFIEDRKKDMILVSGFNVYPNEIEEVAVAHDGVLEAAAVGLPDEKSGEVVKLFVVRKDPALDEAKLKAYFKENLTGYKVPRVIEFRDELPKSNVGKILRRELRDEATG